MRVLSPPPTPSLLEISKNKKQSKAKQVNPLSKGKHNPSKTSQI